MSILLVLIPISLLLLGVAIAAFVWAVKRGQYDDLDTPALDILTDDERPAPPRDVQGHAAAAETHAVHAGPERSEHDGEADDGGHQAQHGRMQHAHSQHDEHRDARARSRD